ncbi:MAG TPA: hypothetical protein PLV68_15965, partial [Ilumatobacteraceae bacterium]|nr:hypothetical protein [Ilumatobacteraceae bacterium]
MNAPVQTTRPTSLSASTPARLRALSAISAVLAVVLGVFGWVAISHRADALDRASDAAQRLIAVQEIRSAVIEADSIATTSFLVGGLEPAEQRARYEERLATAANQMAEQQLDQVSATLTTVAGLVEQARANNRQGFPVGAAYQRQASSVVRDDLLPALDVIERDTRTMVNDAIASAHRIGWVVPFSGVVM